MFKPRGHRGAELERTQQTPTSPGRPAKPADPALTMSGGKRKAL